MYVLADSGAQHILRCIVVLFVFGLCTLCCQFLWIVHSVFCKVYLHLCTKSTAFFINILHILLFCFINNHVYTVNLKSVNLCRYNLKSDVNFLCTEGMCILYLLFFYFIYVCNNLSSFPAIIHQCMK